MENEGKRTYKIRKRGVTPRPPNSKPSATTGSTDGADNASDRGIVTREKRQPGREDVDLNEDGPSLNGSQQDSDKEAQTNNQ